MTQVWYALPERLEGVIERCYPWVGGVAAAILAGAFLPAEIEARIVRNLTGPVIEVSAIAIGFLVAVAVMLAPLKSEPVI